MKETIGLMSIFLSGLCLALIGFRKKRTFAGLLSPKMNENIDTVDKCLAFCASILFLLGILLLIILKY